MSVVVFGIFFVLGAAAIALWIGVRFPQLKPERLAIIMIHLLMVLILGQLLPFGLLVPISASVAIQLMTGLLTIALPVLVYTLLVAIWLLRVAHGALGGMLR